MPCKLGKIHVNFFCRFFPISNPFYADIPVRSVPPFAVTEWFLNIIWGVGASQGTGHLFGKAGGHPIASIFSSHIRINLALCIVCKGPFYVRQGDRIMKLPISGRRQGIHGVSEQQSRSKKPCCNPFHLFHMISRLLSLKYPYFQYVLFYRLFCRFENFKLNFYITRFARFFMISMTKKCYPQNISS